MILIVNSLILSLLIMPATPQEVCRAYIGELEKYSKSTSSEDLEWFDAMVDKTMRQVPYCLELSYKINIETQSKIISRAQDFLLNCPEKNIDYEDRSWCHPMLRDDGDVCFDENKKPFDWCMAYTKFLAKKPKN